MKSISNVEIQKILNASNAVKGTSSYAKYYMECEAKINNKWIFIGNSVPITTLDGTIKTVKDKSYLHIGNYRYTLNNSVKALIEEIFNEQQGDGNERRN